MITLNLLPPSQKSALFARVRHVVLERLMVILVAASIASAILITLAKIQLTKNLAEIVSREMLSSQYAAINDKTRQLNEALVRIDALQKMAYPLTGVIETLTKDAPVGVIVTSLNLNVQTGALQINGSAKDRESLLAYEQVFRSSPIVKDFTSPISNLFQKDNITFQFQAVIDGAAARAAQKPQAP